MRIPDPFGLRRLTASWLTGTSYTLRGLARVVELTAGVLASRTGADVERPGTRRTARACAHVCRVRHVGGHRAPSPRTAAAPPGGGPCTAGPTLDAAVHGTRTSSAVGAGARAVAFGPSAPGRRADRRGCAWQRPDGGRAPRHRRRRRRRRRAPASTKLRPRHPPQRPRRPASRPSLPSRVCRMPTSRRRPRRGPPTSDAPRRTPPSSPPRRRPRSCGASRPCRPTSSVGCTSTSRRPASARRCCARSSGR